MILTQTMNIIDTTMESRVGAEARASQPQAKRNSEDSSFASVMTEARTTVPQKENKELPKDEAACDSLGDEGKGDKSDNAIASEQCVVIPAQLAILMQTDSGELLESGVIQEVPVLEGSSVLTEGLVPTPDNTQAEAIIQTQSNSQSEEPVLTQNNIQLEVLSPEPNNTQPEENISVVKPEQSVAPETALSAEVEAAPNDVKTQTAPTAQTALPAQASQLMEDGAENTDKAIVSVLEGKSNITASPELPTDKAKTQADGAVARMPAETHENEGFVIARTGEGKGDSCPLENGNDNDPTANKDGSGTKAESEGKTEDTKAVAAKSFPLGQMVDVAPDRLSSTIEMRSALETAKPAAPVTTDNLFDSLIENIELNQTNNMNRMTLKLKPDFLGNVTLQLTMGEGGMQIKIGAEDSGVRSMIGAQINTLIETLENRGIKIVGVELTSTDVPNGNLANPQNGDNRQKSDKGSKRIGQSEELLVAAYSSNGTQDLSDIYGGDPEYSSVEYSA